MVYYNQPSSTIVDHYWPWLTMVDLDWPSCPWLTLVVDDWHFTVRAIVELSIFLLLRLRIVNLPSTFVLNDNGHDNTNVSPYLCPSPPSSFIDVNNNTLVSSSPSSLVVAIAKMKIFTLLTQASFPLKPPNELHSTWPMKFPSCSLWGCHDFPFWCKWNDHRNDQRRVLQLFTSNPHIP